MLIMVRARVVGMAESGFFPLVIYYLTTFYRRGELARRLAIFYAASNIANAFSGLLAFGVFRECPHTPCRLEQSPKRRPQTSRTLRFLHGGTCSSSREALLCFVRPFLCI